ncbi:unnamed protein product [Durusdinium trenchii]|uniref:Uncharacterized protein n=2 Tax=Durusdinium trenchii TaxID=1381693 RepID=A0ABP0REN3_9DINO
MEASPSASSSSRRRDGGVLQETLEDDAVKDKDDEEPAPGVVLKLAEVSGCDLDTCCAALMGCDNNFHAALAQLRCSSTFEVGAKARAQMRAALQMLERAREGRSVTRGALGSAWVVAAVMLHAFEYILPRRFLEILFALLGVRSDGPCGLVALLLPVLIALLAIVVLLRDLDGFLNDVSEK